jgi:hypothetical protein
MFSGFIQPINPEEDRAQFQAGVREGIQMSDENLKEITRDFYKSVKRGLLELKMTTGTVTNHSCNCDYCPTSRTRLKI